MKILAVIVTFNGMQWLDRCIGSLQASSVPVDVYVHDNASTDGSADFVAAHFPQAILRRSATNDGFTAGNNAGFVYALQHGYDAVYLLNQDAWIAPDTLRLLSDALSSHPTFALLSPLQLRDSTDTPWNDAIACGKDGCRVVHAKGLATPGLVEGDMDPLFAKNVWAKAGEEKDGIREVQRVMAAHGLVNCEALRKVGLYSELLPIYGQDDNWCDRALYHGYRIGIVPEALAVHDRAQRKEAKERIIYRNYYMGSLVRLLDPRRALFGRWLYVSLFTGVKTVKYASLKPLRYFFGKLLPLRREIRAYRKQEREPYSLTEHV